MENTIQSRLEKAFEAFKDRTAIRYGNKMLTYDELNKKSDSVRDVLYSKGVEAGTFVGIFSDDKIEFISAVMGILKARCVFVPLDPLHPDQRIEYMIQFTEIKYLLTDNVNYDRAVKISRATGTAQIIEMGGKVLFGEEIPDINLKKAYTPDDAIYIFFTSGSTGRPKAILGKNESLLHFTDWETKALSIDENVRVSQLTSPGFDAILRDIFVPVCSGGTVCIPESREIILDRTSLVKWIEESGVNTIHCTPTLFKLINSRDITPESFPYLKNILMAGEKINPVDLKRWYGKFGDRIQLVNLYGPTETTMIKMAYFIRSSDVDRKNIPVGKAISGTKTYILDENMCLCNEGDIGEIYIETPYMTHGYYKNSKLNEEKFIKSPFGSSPEDIIYKTGDLGRLLPDGNTEYLGRVDRQVKIRGNRIEPGEIESELLSFDGISSCVVDLRNGAGKHEGTDSMEYCGKCGLPSSYPGTVIDSEGVCNVCKEYEEFKHKADLYFKPMSDLEKMLCNVQNGRKDGYDCLLLYSGGKDSTYVLYKLMEMGVKVLAYTFDNGYISETAFKNINRIVKECNVDHITGTVSDMKSIFLDGLKEECSVCNGCFKALRVLSTRLAYEKGIKYIVSGLSRGQIYDVRLYDIFKQGIFGTREIEDKIFEQRLLYHSRDDYAARVLGSELQVNRDMLRQVEFIDFFRYCDVGKKEILEFLKEKSSHWSSPEDTGFCSSNCLINDAGIFMQRKYKKYDNYTFPNSWEVRMGHMSIGESRNELESDIDISRVKRILEEIGYDESLNEERNEVYLAAYYVSDGEIREDELRDHLQRNLPEYMIPSHIMRIDSIPVTPNGKLDYSALPDPKAVSKKKYMAPRNEIEVKLSEIWSEILGTQCISIKDNFLSIGGHSLNIMTMISRIYREFEVELPLEVVFNNATIENIAEYIRENDKAGVSSIEPAAYKKYYSLSSAQLRLFTIHQIQDTGTGYNVSTVFSINGKVDEKKLEQAFMDLIERHESLRTSFMVIDGEPAQIINKKVEFKLTLIDWDGSDIDGIINKSIKPFSLSDAPLFRAALIKISEDKSILILDVHHIAADGKSVLIMQRDLMSLYGGGNLPELKVQYKDFAEWQNNLLQSDGIKPQENFWLNAFSGFTPGKGIPTDFPRKKERSFTGGNTVWEIDKELGVKLKKAAAENQATLFMLLLAGFNVLYAKYSAEEDVTIGSPIEGRRYPGLDNIVGMFVNSLAIRSFPEAEKTFGRYLQEVKSFTLKAYENQDYQIDTLVKKLNLHGNLESNPLFDVVFSMLNFGDYTVKVDNLGFEYYENKTTIEIYDLRMEVIDLPDGLKGNIKYSAELFKSETVERMAKDYTTILETIADNVNIKIKDIEIGPQLNKKETDSFAEVDFNFMKNFEEY